MADAADRAGDFSEVALAASLGAISAAMPAGVAGECDECGEWMRRLVRGRCGFCRDGRRPPLATYDRLDAAPAAPIQPQEHAPMSDTTALTSRKITIDGPALAAVDALASSKGVSFKQSANDLILTAAEGGAPQSAELTIEQLMAELGRRVAAASPAELAAANRRAADAEARLAAVRSAVTG